MLLCLGSGILATCDVAASRGASIMIDEPSAVMSICAVGVCMSCSHHDSPTLAIGIPPSSASSGAEQALLKKNTAFVTRERRRASSIKSSAGGQYTGFPEPSLTCDFQVLRIWLVTASGRGT